jgi:hypothetical protein
MALLDRATRSQLLTALNTIITLDTLNGRTLLLQDLPEALTRTVERDEAQAVDLANMVRAADAWSLDALRTLIETARDLVPGSTTAAQLQAVLNTLAVTPAQAPAPLLPDPPAPVENRPGLAGRSRQQSRVTPRVYLLAFVVAFCAALFIHYLGNALVDRITTGWILLDRATIDDWLIALALGLLPALFVAWVIQRLSPSWLIAQLAGNAFGLALYRMLQAPLLDFTPFGTERGDIALLISCTMIAAGILAGLILIEQRQALENPEIVPSEIDHPLR